MTFDPLDAVAREHGMPTEFLRDELEARGVDADQLAVRISDGRASIQDLESVLTK